MNAIALSPEQFVFAHDNELKTNSLKIAEAFEKRHADVLRAIEKITTQVSDSFRERNFALSSYEQPMPNGVSKKVPMYELTKDGFIMVVMSFTGEKAMQIKEAYINAFNLMAEKLFSNRNGLIEIPSVQEPKTKKALPGKLTLDHQDTIKALVKERAESLPKNKQAGAAIKCWSAIKNKYGCSYKEIDDENFVNVISLISRLPLEGELLHKEQGALTLTIAPTDENKQWLASSNNGTVTVKELEANDCIKLLKHHGYIVNHKDHLLNSLSKLIVNVLHPEK